MAKIPVGSLRPDFARRHRATAGVSFLQCLGECSHVSIGQLGGTCGGPPVDLNVASASRDGASDVRPGKHLCHNHGGHSGIVSFSDRLQRLGQAQVPGELIPGEFGIARSPIVLGKARGTWPR